MSTATTTPPLTLRRIVPLGLDGSVLQRPLCLEIRCQQATTTSR
jgi:hypothetical protein